jgi:hypothetical protein
MRYNISKSSVTKILALKKAEIVSKFSSKRP